ncbi:DUF742 domain-containing protein [Amycolatopsis cynarae]|uniref:DUF742 domain-containing protein n=1 Tax=Amycolatopsis cynarae TaxID=2995223 RepID=A0ABY7B9K8_9PSEU|nr:DUF742 domain-containing protein [Amycolatopsis sp. HUAS 11-8]WAL67546.1 DUF742 domain-containing protein [Amycolatopsis sp. HUAS 11-8]
MSTDSGSGSPPEDGDDATFADVLNGFTLDSRRSRRKRKRDKGAETEPSAASQPEQAVDHPQTGYATGEYSAAGYGSGGYGTGEYATGEYGTGEYATGEYGTVGYGSVDYDRMLPSPEYAPPPGPPGFAEPGRETGFFEPAVSNSGPMLPERPEPELFDDAASVVRPYALTGGRTRANYALELETLISVNNAAAARVDAGEVVQIEHRSIMEECRTPRSVAEVAALLRVPIGVARVLISDAADAGLITVHKTVSGKDNAEAHFMLMERVLSGLRRL